MLEHLSPILAKFPGDVAALLGVLIHEVDGLKVDADRYRWLKQARPERWNSATWARAKDLDTYIDGMKQAGLEAPQ